MWERATSGGVMAAGLQAGTRGLHVGTGDEWRPGYKREREGYMWERATCDGVEAAGLQEGTRGLHVGTGDVLRRGGGRATRGNARATCHVGAADG